VWEVDEGEVELEGSLGTGDSGEVFSASWRGRPVAIKTIHTDIVVMTSVERERLCRELAILTNMDHPNVVRIMGLLLPHRPVRIMMERCDGGNCFDLLHKSDVQLSLSQKLDISTQVSKAMAYLHWFDPPIIHRDLNTRNLLLLSPVQGPEDECAVKVTDFGLSRPKPCSSASQPTDHNLFLSIDVGTLPYMAPDVEHALYDEKVDVYSYSMILYELIVRQIPFGIDMLQDTASTLRMVRDGERPDLGLVPNDCPTNLVELMQAGWDKDPAQRPSFPAIVKVLAKITS